MLIDLSGRRALVTGAGHGIGRAIARALQASGAEVAISDLDAGELAETAAGTMSVHPLDLCDAKALARVAEAVGAVDLFVASAGGVAGQVGQPLESVSAADWQHLFDINVTGTFRLAQALVPAMKQAGRGRIVTISSGAGLGPSLTGIQAYAAAKHALVGLTRQLAQELGRFGITVNSVAPGFVRSNPASERQWQSYGPDGQQALLSRIAMRRLGTPEDIAAAVVFLCSDQASWITGQVLQVDGGK